MNIQIFNIIIAILIAIPSIILFIFILQLLSGITKYFKELRNYQFMINTKEHRDEMELSLNERISSTVEFINLCNIIIDNEIAKNLSGYSRLNKKYDMTKFDTDYKNMAESVYNSIKSEIIDNRELIISSDFVLQHIIDETMIRFMRYTEDFNNNFKK